MFGLGKKERALYERLLAEKDRIITALADEIDWLRLKTGTPTPVQAVNPSEQPPYDGPMQSGAAWMSEEEEDIAHLHKLGALSLAEMEKALAEVGFRGTEIDEYTIN